MLGFWILWSILMVGILITPGLGMWVLSRRRDQETMDQTIVAGTTDGSVACVFMEDDSPTLCEVQSLVMAKVTTASGATTVNGTTANRFPADYYCCQGSQHGESASFLARRLHMLLAVAKARLGIDLFSRHVYLNVVGDAHVKETGADIAVALAVFSSHTSTAVRWDTCFIGEVGLWGELKPVESLAERIQLAEERGFSRVVVPLDQKSTLRSSGRSGCDADGRPDADLSESAEEDTTSVVDGGALGASGEGRADGITIVGCRDIKECIVEGFTSVPTCFRGLRKLCDARAAGSAAFGGGSGGGDSARSAQAAGVDGLESGTRRGTATTARGGRRIGISTLSPVRRDVNPLENELKEEIKNVDWGGEWGVVRRMG